MTEHSKALPNLTCGNCNAQWPANWEVWPDVQRDALQRQSPFDLSSLPTRCPCCDTALTANRPPEAPGAPEQAEPDLDQMIAASRADALKALRTALQVVETGSGRGVHVYLDDGSRVRVLGGGTMDTAGYLRAMAVMLNLRADNIDRIDAALGGIVIDQQDRVHIRGARS